MRKNNVRIDLLANDIYNKNQAASKERISSKEQSFGLALTELGRRASVIEYYYNIKPIDQDYTSVNDYNQISKFFTKEEMIESIPFQKGYNYLSILLKSGKVENLDIEKYKHR